MLKTLHIACLTGCAIGAGFLGIGATGGQRSADAPRPSLVAMQEPQANPNEGQKRPTASPVGWIGVVLDGVRVKAVFPAGPAAFAGVREGDTLVRIGDANVDSTASAEAAIERLVPGRRSLLTIQRHGKSVELKVTPGNLAEFREHYISEMLRRDPRDPKFGQLHGVSEADISVEVVRRLFEQHQRLETTLIELTKEIEALRTEVRALRLRR
ncbi:MAG TPA: PDZ domain-containing protein [Planctomycetaceae bacterium]|jgi:membrane-associated protease RseP (regulator of RpoE activity)|nr:PDZ domain-containing protein [Planctomycetaceae bacterium]